MPNQPQLILPTPKTVQVAEGELIIPAAVLLANPSWNSFAETLRTSLEKIFECEIENGNGIWLQQDCSLAPASYVVDTLGEQMLLTASDDEGICYAIATALQLITVQKNQICVARTHIEDAPDKSYRGVMIDLARQWHPASKIYQYIDICFMLKLRYLHLHFVDDQSYTLPSRTFPKLMKKNRHYTEEDIASFRAYANARGVVLIPELEAPGHAAFLIEQYPEVFGNKLDNGETTSLVTENGTVITARNTICAGNPVTFDAVRTLIKETCELFPEAPFIHIGGDEANIRAWDYCEHCRTYMQQHGIQNVKELYSEFTGRVAQTVLELGKTPIVWEGFPKEGVRYIPKETVVIAWESLYHLPNDLLEAGFKIINASWKPLYHVPNPLHCWEPKEILHWNVYTWQNWYEKSAAYLNPIHVAPTDHVLGAQFCFWENTYELEISHVLVKSAALSERVWRLERRDDDDACYVRIKIITKLMARLIQER